MRLHTQRFRVHLTASSSEVRTLCCKRLLTITGSGHLVLSSVDRPTRQSKCSESECYITIQTHF